MVAMCGSAVRRISTFRFTASLFAVLVSTSSLTAYAQPVPSAEGADVPPDQGLDEIIVTARKVSENLQEVPVSVTAFSGEALENRNLVSFRDVALFTPGFVTREAPSNSSAFSLALRGQAQNDVLATLDPSVGTYVDGVYWSRSYGLNADLLDVQSVQVLKGPQGTLFGRNTTAGAFLVQSNDPDTSEISGLVQATYGRFNERIGTAVLNLPLGEHVAVRGAVQLNKRDGFVRDRVSGERYNNRDNLQGRAKILLQPSESVRLILSGEWFAFDQKPGRFIAAAPASLRAVFPQLTDEIAANLADDDTLITSSAPYNSLLGTGTVPFNHVRTQTFNGTLALDTAFGEVRWINSYRRVRAANAADLDGSSAPEVLTTLEQNLKQYSSELQATGQLLDDKLTFAVGAVYLRETGFDRSLTFSPAATVTRFDGRIENDSMGIYSQASFAVSDDFNITAGIRYSIDDKGIETHTGVLNRLIPGLPPLTLLSCIDPGRSVAANCFAQRQDSFSAISYTLGADYKIADGVLVYAKQSRGYRSGGQQLRTFTAADSAPFQPEIVNEQEVGLKSEFLDRRLRLNIAGYHNKIADAQRSQIVLIGGALPQTQLENADVENYGVEADLSFRVAGGLVLGATGSYNDPKYTSYIGVITNPDPAGAPIVVDKSSFRFDSLAKEQFTLSADYSADLGFGTLKINANYSWVGRYDTNGETVASLSGGLVGLDGQPIPAQMSVADAEAIVAATRKRAAGLAGARVAVEFENGLELAIFGRNIFDTRYIQHGLFVGSYVSAIRNDPATYGVSAAFRF